MEKNSFIVLALALVACFVTTAECLGVPENLTEVAKEVLANAKEDWFPGIETWEPPEEFKKNLRYYLMGYDYNHRPVMVWEAGKWDVRKYLDDPKTKDDMFKHMEQFWFRAQNVTSPYPDAEEGVVIILDADQFSPAQLLSLEVIKFHLFSMRLGEKYESSFSDIFFINLSFVGETWVNIIRPIGGRFIGRADTYGPSKEKWGPVLSSKIPKDQLAPWYTGKEGFKPAKIWD